MIDYLNELREACLEAYTGIIQGLKGDSNASNPAPELALIQPHVAHIIAFIVIVAQDTDHSDGNVAACAGLVG
jgi:importin subunit beta-1